MKPSQRRRGLILRIIAITWLYAIVLAYTITGCTRVPPQAVPAEGLRPLPLPMSSYEKSIYVDSIQPTLRWETFPRPEDFKMKTDKPIVSIQNITYELRIWLGKEDFSTGVVGGRFPDRLVYTRSGLTEPTHKVEILLEPDTLYLWTIRAHFELDGNPRVTEWGVPIFSDWRRRSVTFPYRSHYEFMTPKL